MTLCGLIQLRRRRLVFCGELSQRVLRHYEAIVYSEDGEARNVFFWLRIHSGVAPHLETDQPIESWAAAPDHGPALNTDLPLPGFRCPHDIVPRHVLELNGVHACACIPVA